LAMSYFVARHMHAGAPYSRLLTSATRFKFSEVGEIK
jgi:hypothetical protein